MKDTRKIFLNGMHDGIPIALGYFAVSFSLGIIAKKTGLSALQGFAGSGLTRASAGEYSVYTLIAAGASILEIVLMCIIANLRYLLMGASLTQKFAPGMSLPKRLIAACCITDEIFGISIARPGDLPLAYPAGATILAGTFWAAGTATGILAGGMLPVSMVSALSVALYGMFLAIIIPPARLDHAVRTSVLAGFILSWCCSILPVLSSIQAGTRTILLTVAISATAAMLKPVPVEEPAGAAGTTPSEA